ncbi:MAG: AMIN-like domain-containing (lipo)protein [Nocardioides sp.]
MTHPSTTSLHPAPRPAPRPAARRLAGLALALVAALPGSLVAGPTYAATAPAEWRTTETHWANPRVHAAIVTGLRYARHGRFDRVVVDVDGRRPGYRTLFPAQLTYDPSGRAVPLHGRYRTALVLRHAATYAADGTNRYAGPRLVRPDLPGLRGIALTGSFEGVTSFGFTSRTRVYRIFTLTDPSRVVIDFRHPAG